MAQKSASQSMGKAENGFCKPESNKHNTKKAKYFTELE